MQEDYTGYLIKINKTIYYVKKDDGTYLYCDKVNYNAGKNESNYETTVKILKNSKYKIYDDLSDVNPAKKEDEKSSRTMGYNKNKFKWILKISIKQNRKQALCCTYKKKC